MSAQQSIEQKLAALQSINNKYKELIESNPILTNDFAKLMKAIRLSESASGANCEKIINHLISEIVETTEDSYRMADEAPLSPNDNSSVYTYIALRQALETYQLNYLAT